MGTRGRWLGTGKRCSHHIQVSQERPVGAAVLVAQGGSPGRWCGEDEFDKVEISPKHVKSTRLTEPEMSSTGHGRAWMASPCSASDSPPWLPLELSLQNETGVGSLLNHLAERALMMNAKYSHEPFPGKR